MGGDNYVHDDFRHSKLRRLSVQTWVSDCVTRAGLSALFPHTPDTGHKDACFPWPQPDTLRRDMAKRFVAEADNARKQ